MPRSPRIGECVAAGLLALVVSVALPSGSQGAAGQAKGTLSHKGKSVTLAHAYLVTGPDAVDPKKTIRRLILSTKDLGAKIPTQGFCPRPKRDGTQYLLGTMSEHGFGHAVDIEPAQAR